MTLARGELGGTLARDAYRGKCLNPDMYPGFEKQGGRGKVPQ